jgi:uncharacterized Zn finger protein (UPF0148 family)
MWPNRSGNPTPCSRSILAPSIVAFSCPHCGADLDLKPKAAQITCGFCGKAVIVNWEDDTPSQEPAVETPKQTQVAIQRDSRSKDRTEAELLLQRVEQERMAAEGAAVQESRQLNRLHVIIGQNRFYSFAAMGFALLIAACLGLSAVSTLSSALRADASVADPIGTIFVLLCLTGIVLGVGLFMLWAMSSASRRLSGQIREHEQHGKALRSELQGLRQQEAQVRDRLVG